MISAFYVQSSWLGIDFASLGVPLDPTRPASEDFYDAFYRALRDRYSGYVSLPQDWRQIKVETAGVISRLIPPDSRTLSVGCGIGYVEHRLVTAHGFTQLSAWEPAVAPRTFDPDSQAPFLIADPMDRMAPSGQWDSVLAIQLVYALPDSSLEDWLSLVRGRLRHGGALVMANFSPDFSENGRSPRTWATVGRRMARSMRSIRPKQATSTESNAQGWGWARDNESIARLARRSGFESVTFHAAARQSFALCKIDE